MTRREFLKLAGGAGIVALASLLGINSILGNAEVKKMVQPEVDLMSPEVKGAYYLSWHANPWVWANVAILGSKVKGMLLKPGVEHSLLDIADFKSMSAVSRKNTDPSIGYVAGQMRTGKDGWGYRLCLGSTLLFRTLLDSPLRVTKHNTHFDVYNAYFNDMHLGTDAAIYYPDDDSDIDAQDLRFTNPTNSTYRFDHTYSIQQENRLRYQQTLYQKSTIQENTLR